jgi:hypothetical protein
VLPLKDSPATTDALVEPGGRHLDMRITNPILSLTLFHNQSLANAIQPIPDTIQAIPGADAVQFKDSIKIR